MRERGNKVLRQDGIVIGNIEDKANLKNPFSRYLVEKFDKTVFKFLQQSSPNSLHEVGCGEGRLTNAIAARYEVPIRASDFSRDLIERLREENRFSQVTFIQRSIYDLTPEEDGADVVVCCEVLEHLERAEEALGVLRNLKAGHYILSVPREPVWRVLNVARGKYLKNYGNTPGHLNHWSKRSFLRFLSGAGFRFIAVESPLPWTIVLGQFSS